MSAPPNIQANEPNFDRFKSQLTTKSSRFYQDIINSIRAWGSYSDYLYSLTIPKLKELLDIILLRIDNARWWSSNDKNFFNILYLEIEQIIEDLSFDIEAFHKEIYDPVSSSYIATKQFLNFNTELKDYLKILTIPVAKNILFAIKSKRRGYNNYAWLYDRISFKIQGDIVRDCMSNPPPELTEEFKKTYTKNHENLRYTRLLGEEIYYEDEIELLKSIKSNSSCKKLITYFKGLLKIIKGLTANAKAREEAKAKGEVSPLGVAAAETGLPGTSTAGGGKKIKGKRKSAKKRKRGNTKKHVLKKNTFRHFLGKSVSKKKKSVVKKKSNKGKSVVKKKSKKRGKSQKQ